MYPDNWYLSNIETELSLELAVDADRRRRSRASKKYEPGRTPLTEAEAIPGLRTLPPPLPPTEPSRSDRVASYRCRPSSRRFLPPSYETTESKVKPNEKYAVLGLYLDQ